jgi:hypothetical protein
MVKMLFAVEMKKPGAEAPCNPLILRRAKALR